MALPEIEFWDYDEWMALIRKWPKEVRKIFGEKMREVQHGHQPRTGAKPLTGFGIALWELKRKTGQRLVYTVKYVNLAGRIFVLDAFEKDSAEGSKMRKDDRERIKKRVTDLNKRMETLKRTVKKPRTLH